MYFFISNKCWAKIILRNKGYINKQGIFFLSVFFIIGILFSACTRGKLEIRVTNQKFQTRSDMIITGKNFTAGKPVTITLTNFPGIDGNITGNITADLNGNFTYRKEFAYRTVDRNQDFINILVAARDEATGKVVIENTSSAPYLIRR